MLYNALLMNVHDPAYDTQGHEAPEVGGNINHKISRT